MKLVDNPEEQRILEELLDENKPPVPESCRHLHYLLFTPFRYEARSDSRFRRSGKTPPVFYAAENIETAVAEKAFWQLLVFYESPDTPWVNNPLELTAFSVRYSASLCLDLTRAPYEGELELWRHPTDYAPAQRIADIAREANCEAIRSVSARDAEERCNITLLSCAGFDALGPDEYRTWRMKLGPSGVAAICEQPQTEVFFDRAYFARDPRIANLNWER